MIPISQIETNKGQIKGLPKNPRLIRDEHFKKLLQSIKDNPEMLYLRELLVYPHQGKYVVIGGNMKLMAMKDLGYTEAPCKVIPEDTTVEQLKAYTIKDNAAYGEWDYDLLANEWDAQDLDDWCVYVWQDINDEHKEPETQEDDFDEETADIPPVSKAGDIFQLGNHILMCGDSTNPDDVARLMDGQQADMVFTDPPYGVSYVGTNNPNGKEWKMIENDDLRGDKLYQFLKAAFQNIAEHLKRGGAFYIWFASVNHIQFETAINVNGLRVKQELIWDKGMVLLGLPLGIRTMPLRMPPRNKLDMVRRQNTESLHRHEQNRHPQDDQGHHAGHPAPPPRGTLGMAGQERCGLRLRTPDPEANSPRWHRHQEQHRQGTHRPRPLRRQRLDADGRGAAAEKSPRDGIRPALRGLHHSPMGAIHRTEGKATHQHQNR